MRTPSGVLIAYVPFPEVTELIGGPTTKVYGLKYPERLIPKWHIDGAVRVACYYPASHPSRLEFKSPDLSDIETLESSLVFFDGSEEHRVTPIEPGAGPRYCVSVRLRAHA